MNLKFLLIPNSLACANFFLTSMLPVEFDSVVYILGNGAVAFFIGYQAIKQYDKHLWVAALYVTTIVVTVFILGVITSFFDHATSMSMKLQGYIGYFFSLLFFVPIFMLVAVIGGITARKIKRYSELKGSN